MMRDLLIVAGFEVREMLRTRRAVVLMALYLLGGFMAARGFTRILTSIENAAAQALGTAAVTTPGALTRTLMADPNYPRVIGNIVGDPALAAFLVQLPPMVLFYTWSSLAMVPMLVTITATDTVSQEIQNRGIRFILLRTGRIEFVLGKLLGQAILMAVVTFMALWIYMAVAAYGLRGFEFWPTLRHIIWYWPRVVLYGSVFIALSALFSIHARSTNIARALAIMGLGGTWILHVVIEHALEFEQVPALDPLLLVISQFLPYTYRMSLWYPDLATVATGVLALVVLITLYLVIGLLVFNRKDV